MIIVEKVCIILLVRKHSITLEELKMSYFHIWLFLILTII